MTTVVCYDTCSVLDLITASRSAGSATLLRSVIEGRAGKDARHGYHPLTLAEIASKHHAEVIAADGYRHNRPVNAANVRATVARFALAHRALAAAAKGPDGPSELLGLRLLRLAVSDASILRMAKLRVRRDLLRCTSKSRVLPLAALADHQILQAALDLHDAGVSVIFASSDAESLGAAAALGVPVLNTKRPLEVAPGWQTCPADRSCWPGGTTTCDTFAKVPSLGSMAAKASVDRAGAVAAAVHG